MAATDLPTLLGERELTSEILVIAETALLALLGERELTSEILVIAGADLSILLAMSPSTLPTCAGSSPRGSGVSTRPSRFMTLLMFAMRFLSSKNLAAPRRSGGRCAYLAIVLLGLALALALALGKAEEPLILVLLPFSFLAFVLHKHSRHVVYRILVDRLLLRLLLLLYLLRDNHLLHGSYGLLLGCGRWRCGLRRILARSAPGSFLWGWNRGWLRNRLGLWLGLGLGLLGLLGLGLLGLGLGLGLGLLGLLGLDVHLRFFL